MKVGNLQELFKKEKQKIRKAKDKDAMKLANLYCIHKIIVSDQNKVNVSNFYVRLLENEEEFKRYPWGRASYNKTLHGFKQGSNNTCDTGFAVYGFPYAVLIWAFERLPFIWENNIVELHKDTITPRMLKWKISMQPAWETLNELFEYESKCEFVSIIHIILNLFLSYM